MSFVVIEGGEGVGKGTLMEGLKRHFKDAVFTREPGGTPMAEEIRDCNLRPRQEPVAPDTELLLMFAARAQHLAQLILPALDQGQLVISDRFTDSSYAYQGVARGLGAEKVELLEQFVQGDLRPDLVVVLDLDPFEGQSRIRDRAEGLDRLDAETLQFHQAVRQAFLSRAERSPERYCVVDAAQAPERVLEQVIRMIEGLS